MASGAQTWYVPMIPLSVQKEGKRDKREILKETIKTLIKWGLRTVSYLIGEQKKGFLNIVSWLTLSWTQTKDVLTCYCA
jgi:hypothetical protein